MPTEKRARQRAARYEKKAEMAKRKKRRQNMRRALSVGLVGAVVVAIVILLANTGGGKKKVADKTTTTTTTLVKFAPPTTQPFNTTAAAAICPSATEKKRIVWFASAPPHCIPANSVWDATFSTSVGSFAVRMDAASSYAAVNDFVFLARWNFYNGTFFHRVIKDFIVQGGDPTGTGEGEVAKPSPHTLPGYSFTGNTPPSSCSAKKDCYPTGSLALANSSSSPKTDGSQFFITVGKGGSELSPDYTLFGHVTTGMSVVNKIDSYGAPITSEQGVPKVRVYLLKVTLKQVKA